MAFFSSKKKLKPCYDNDPYLRVKKELEEVVTAYTVKTSM